MSLSYRVLLIEDDGDPVSCSFLRVRVFRGGTWSNTTTSWLQRCPTYSLRPVGVSNPYPVIKKLFHPRLRRSAKTVRQLKTLNLSPKTFMIQKTMKKYSSRKVCCPDTNSKITIGNAAIIVTGIILGASRNHPSWILNPSRASRWSISSVNVFGATKTMKTAIAPPSGTVSPCPYHHLFKDKIYVPIKIIHLVCKFMYIGTYINYMFIIR